MENVITEFRVIETDDGFRIEIKGDKEKIRPFLTGSGWSHKHGPGFARGPFGWGFPPMMWAHMASCWGPWNKETDDTQKAA